MPPDGSVRSIYEKSTTYALVGRVHPEGIHPEGLPALQKKFFRALIYTIRPYCHTVVEDEVLGG